MCVCEFIQKKSSKKETHIQKWIEEEQKKNTHTQELRVVIDGKFTKRHKKRLKRPKNYTKREKQNTHISKNGLAATHTHAWKEQRKTLAAEHDEKDAIRKNSQCLFECDAM